VDQPKLSSKLSNYCGAVLRSSLGALAPPWVWQPKNDQVSYEGKDKDGKPVKVTYVRSKLDGEAANVKDEIDPAFLNDQYWLLFPFHVYWDSSADVQDLGVQKLPLGRVPRSEWQ
jgi:hypothetical protein